MISFIAVWHNLVRMISFIMFLSYNFSRLISFIVVWHDLFRTISFIVFLYGNTRWTSSSTLVSLSPLPFPFVSASHFLVSTLVSLSLLSFPFVSTGHFLVSTLISLSPLSFPCLQFRFTMYFRLFLWQ
jgi:hypothetical protein